MVKTQCAYASLSYQQYEVMGQAKQRSRKMSLSLFGLLLINRCHSILLQHRIAAHLEFCLGWIVSHSNEPLVFSVFRGLVSTGRSVKKFDTDIRNEVSEARSGATGFPWSPNGLWMFFLVNTACNVRKHSHNKTKTSVCLTELWFWKWPVILI